MKPSVSLAAYMACLVLSLVAYQNCADVTFSTLQSSESALELGMNPSCIGEDNSISFTVDNSNSYLFSCKQVTDTDFVDCTSYVLDDGVVTISADSNTVTFDGLENDSYFLTIQVEDSQGQIDIFNANVPRCPQQTCGQMKNSCHVCTDDNSYTETPRAKTITCGQGSMTGFDYVISQKPDGGSKTECGTTCHKRGICSTNACSDNNPSDCAKCGATCMTNSNGCKSCSGGTACASGQICQGGGCVTPPQCTTANENTTCPGSCNSCVGGKCNGGQVTCTANTGTCTACPDGQCGQPVTNRCSANSCQVCDSTCGRPRAKTCSEINSIYLDSCPSGKTCTAVNTCGKTCYHSPKTSCSTNACSDNNPSDCAKCGATCMTNSNGCKSCSGGTACASGQICQGGGCVTPPQCTTANENTTCPGSCNSCVGGKCNGGQVTCIANTGTCTTCPDGQCGQPVTNRCSANSCQVCDSTCGRPRAKTCSDYSQQSTRSGLTCPEETSPGCGLTCYREGTRCSTSSCQACDNACGSSRAKECVDYGYQSNTSGLTNPVTVNPGCSLRCYKESTGPICTNECSSSSNCTKCGASCTTSSDGCKDCTGGTTCNTTCQSCRGTSCVTDSCGSGYFTGYSYNSPQDPDGGSRTCTDQTCYKRGVIVCGSGSMSSYPNSSNPGCNARSKKGSGVTCWSDRVPPKTCTSNPCRSGQTCTNGTGCNDRTCATCTPRTCTSHNLHTSKQGCGSTRTSRSDGCGSSIRCYTSGTTPKTCTSNPCRSGQTCTNGTGCNDRTCATCTPRTCTSHNLHTSKQGCGSTRTSRSDGCGSSIRCYTSGTTPKTCTSNPCRSGQTCTNGTGCNDRTCTSCTSRTCSYYGLHTSNQGCGSTRTSRSDGCGSSIRCYTSGTTPKTCTSNPCRSGQTCTNGTGCNDRTCATCTPRTCTSHNLHTSKQGCGSTRTSRSDGCGSSITCWSTGRQCSGGQQCVNGSCKTTTQTTTQTTTTTSGSGGGSGSWCVSCRQDWDCAGSKCEDGCCSGEVDD